MTSLLSTLKNQLKEIATINSIAATIHWDRETYMPPGAIEERAEQESYLATLSHQKQTGSDLQKTLSSLLDLETGNILNTKLDNADQQFLREVYRDYRHATALPSDFVAQFSKTTAQSQHYWGIARDKKDFSIFLPWLKDVIALNQKKARYLSPDSFAYDTLLDLYEPGLGVDTLDPLFENLKEHTVSLLNTIQPKLNDIPKISGTFPTNLQWDFGIQIIKKIGFNFENGRQDKSTHPFSTRLSASDVRITTRMSEHHFDEGFSSTIHEAGHALYEQQLPKEWFGTPFGEATSLGIHESQSRFWENTVCKSSSFWNGHFDQLQALFPTPLEGHSSSTFYAQLNRVSPGFIRVEADELTYNLHILIRYELEKRLISGDLSPNDLPAAWNKKYSDYLGVTPHHDREGCLQDVHWSCGYFGYFPTYTLGNMMSSMFTEKMRTDIPHFDSLLNNGNFDEIRLWLEHNIHSVARRKRSSELVETVCGTPLSAEPLITYLKLKFGKLYNV